MRHNNGINMDDFSAHMRNLNIRAQYSNPNDTRKDKASNIEMMITSAENLLYRLKCDLDHQTNDKYHTPFVNKG